MSLFDKETVGAPRVARQRPQQTQECAKTPFDDRRLLDAGYALVMSLFMESSISRVRDAELRPKADLIALLLTCCDHVSTMVSQLANSDEIYLGHLNRSHGLIRQLRAYHGNRVEHATAT